MSKTHIAVGIASSLLIVQPKSTTECLTAVLGGTIGGIISDVDVKSNDYCKDALYGRLIAALMIAVVLFADWITGGEIVYSIINPDRRILVISGIILSFIWILAGMTQNHRSFTHSFLALILLSGSLYMIYPAITNSFVIGFLSHLFLDLMNKKRVQLFFPIGKGFCLGICYADKTANFVFLLGGLSMSIILLGYFLIVANLR